MSHKCSTLIIHCLDFRFIPDLKKFLADEGLMGDCDEVSIAGGIKDLLGEGRDLILKQVDISSRLHSISRVIFIAHEDCGAYGGKKSFANDETEFSKHKEDLAKAKEIILTKFPELKVDFVFARIKEKDGINEIWFLKWLK